MGINKKIVFVLCSTFLLVPFFSHAATLFPNIWEGTSKTVTYASGTMLASTTQNCNVAGSCNLCDALQVFKNIVDILFQIAIPLAVVLIIYGGIRIMTAGGSEQNVSEAKNIITSALIGLVISLGSWLIINTILHLITGNIALPWSNIECI